MNDSVFSNFTVVIPTLNEAETILELLTQLKTLYPEIKIIVADDESSDSTQEIVKGFATNYPEWEVQILERIGLVHGLTASVVDAILMVKTPYLIVMDGDLQHPTAVITEMIDKILSGNDVIAGARIPYKQNQGIHRIVITKLATAVAKIFLRIINIHVSDPMSGFFCIKSGLAQEAIRKNKNKFEPRGYKVFFELLRVLPKSLRIEECFYQFAFRSGGHSKLTPKHFFFFVRSLFR